MNYKEETLFNPAEIKTPSVEFDIILIVSIFVTALISFALSLTAGYVMFLPGFLVDTA